MRQIEKKQSVEKDKTRLDVIGLLTASSLAFLAVLHSDNTVLGLEIASGSFVEIMVNFFKIILWFEVIVDITFILTTGYFNGYHYDENYNTNIKTVQGVVDKWYKIMHFLQRKSYDFAIGIFASSLISIILNVFAKLFGFYGDVSIVVAGVVMLEMILFLMLMAAWEYWKKKKQK